MRENPIFSRVLKKSVLEKTVGKIGKNSRSYYSLFPCLDTSKNSVQMETRRKRHEKSCYILFNAYFSYKLYGM